jgi:NAD(P)-dependent dehydrogenase (short-subunit alcohol dehydrogenase family)
LENEPAIEADGAHSFDSAVNRRAGGDEWMNNDRKAIVIGVGPERGLGAALGQRFAAEGHHVYAAGRTRAKLDKVVAAIRNRGGRATPVVVDATREADILRLFDIVIRDGAGVLDLAVYNVGVNTPGRIAEMSADYFEGSWRTSCFGGFLFGRQAVRHMLPQGGTLIFTGASASLRGRSGFGAFNAAKASLRSLAQAMAKEYGPDGLHVAHVVVDGGIHGDKVINDMPEFAESRGEDGLLALNGLADIYWQLYRQQSRSWTFEVDVRTHREPW